MAGGAGKEQVKVITTILLATSRNTETGVANIWVPFFISAALVAMGALMAFDIGGFASESARNNTGFTPWGRKYRAPGWLPQPYTIVGWTFLVVGVPIFLLSLTDLILGG